MKKILITFFVILYAIVSITNCIYATENQKDPGEILKVIENIHEEDIDICKDCFVLRIHPSWKQFIVIIVLIISLIIEKRICKNTIRKIIFYLLGIVSILMIIIPYIQNYFKFENETLTLLAAINRIGLLMCIVLSLIIIINLLIIKLKENKKERKDNG